MNKESKEKIPVMTRVRSLSVGEYTDAPIEMLASVKSNVSIYGKMTQRIFSCNIRNAERVVRITRTA